MAAERAEVYKQMDEFAHGAERTRRHMAGREQKRVELLRVRSSKPKPKRRAAAVRRAELLGAAAAERIRPQGLVTPRVKSTPSHHTALPAHPAWAAPLRLLVILGTLAPDTVYAATDGHAESIWVTLARIANFAILAGALVYFLKAPLMGYLDTRGTQIRQDLVTAAGMREAAAAQLAAIAGKMQALRPISKR